jgi:hypothetical protein
VLNEEEEYKERVHARPLAVLADEVQATMIDHERVQVNLSQFCMATRIRTFRKGNGRFFLVI